MHLTAPAPTVDSVPGTPLLPGLLARPAAYLWLWALPILVMIALNLAGYAVIAGDMNPEQRDQAYQVGGASVLNLALGLALYGVALGQGRRGGRVVPWWYGGYAVVIQVAYLWLSCTAAEEMIPRSAALWIYPPQRFLLNQFSFAMLPLFFGILQLACAQRSTAGVRSMLASAGAAFAAPVLLYVGFVAFGQLSDGGTVAIVLICALAVTLGVVMFVGLVRAGLLALRVVRGASPAAEPVAIVIVALVLPFAGLLLNRLIPFPVDFQAWEVYALTSVNAAVLLLASWRGSEQPRLCFALLCGTLPFALYFFIVFLPYTPLSILAVIVLGVGFLVLTPTLLFILQIHLLNHAWAACAKAGQRRAATVGLGVLCFALLPAFFVARALADRSALHRALDYVQTPAVAAGDLRYEGSLGNLRRALRNHRAYKNGIYYPLLSDFYSWAVFDHLVLADPTLAQLEEVFIGRAGASDNGDPLRTPRGSFLPGPSVRERQRAPRAAPLAKQVAVNQLEVRPAGDPTTGGFTLVFALQATTSAVAEYETQLPLPPGMFVTGLRLEVRPGELTPGRISEKKTAQWVYTMIRDTERRDPALLFYTSPDELELRVFPITAQRATRVEIDFVGPRPLPLAQAPVDARHPAAVLEWARAQLGAAYVSTAQGTWLGVPDSVASSASATREPYLHVIIDGSTQGFDGEFSAVAPAITHRFPQARLARVSVASCDVVSVTREPLAVEKLGRLEPTAWQGRVPRSGGLALDLAVAQALQQHVTEDLANATGAQLPARPVIVVLTRNASEVTGPLRVAEHWMRLCPDAEIHVLGSDARTAILRPPAAGPTAWLRWNGIARPVVGGTASWPTGAAAQTRFETWSASTQQWVPADDIRPSEAQPQWTYAVALQLAHEAYTRSPGSVSQGLEAQVAASRSLGILSPATSYIVVENSAQWKMLELSERQKLGQNEALEFRETPAPSAATVAGAFAAFLWWRHRRSRPRLKPRTARPNAGAAWCLRH